MTQPIHPMLKRVAQAIAAVNHPLEVDDWDAYLTDARAAVQALMEPDEGMVEAGEDAMIYTDGDFVRNRAETVYQAMLRPLVEGEAS